MTNERTRAIQASKAVTVQNNQKPYDLLTRLYAFLPAHLLLGVLVVIALPAALIWGWGFWLNTAEADVHRNTFAAATLAFLTASISLRRLHRYPGSHMVSYIIPAATVSFLIVAALLLMTRAAYSRPVLLSAYTLTLVWCFVDYFLLIRHRQLRLAVVPFGRAQEMSSTPHVIVENITTPALPNHPVDGVVADLHSPELGPRWARFLARCTLQGIPVYHTRQIQESLTGQVIIEHLSENEFGSLLPSYFYASFKRLTELAIVILSMPVVLPIMALTALAIRLDSPGPALFVQTRIGRGNREFRMIKFRSMWLDAERDGASLAHVGDARVTRIGRLLRKTRLDELPQFFNVLIGDMSLIGPRPEQRPFVSRFEDEIPFYSYRHVVRPGITGWAQVMQGYAGDTDDTRIKLQFDLYYIKHFSLWLDILITLKTLRILVSGKGAR